MIKFWVEGKRKIITSFIPKEWFQDNCVNINSNIYKVDYLQDFHIPNGMKSILVDDVQLIIFKGELKHPQIIDKKDEIGSFLIVLMNTTSERNSDFDLRVFSGLIAKACGRNSVKKFLFSSAFSICDSQFVSWYSGEIKHSYGEINGPKFDDGSINGLINDYTKIKNLSNEKFKNRIRRALLWFNEAQNDIGTISFLKYWIAIETLCKDEPIEKVYCNKIIKKAPPVLESLSRRLQEIYEIDDKTVREKFLLSKLAKLRAITAHHGKAPRLSIGFIRYCELLFVDIFSYELNQTKIKKSLDYFNNENMKLPKELKKIVK